jgi:hypothetical protein
MTSFAIFDLRLCASDKITSVRVFVARNGTPIRATALNCVAMMASLAIAAVHSCGNSAGVDITSAADI